MVDVMEEQVQRAHALIEATLDFAPLFGGNDARHQVERHDFVDAFRTLVDSERDAARLERQVSRALAAFNLVVAERGQRTRQAGVVRSDLVG